MNEDTHTATTYSYKDSQGLNYDIDMQNSQLRPVSKICHANDSPTSPIQFKKYSIAHDGGLCIEPLVRT